MDDGKRSACNAKFLEMLPKFASGEWTGAKFRAEVRFYMIEEFSCTGGAASSHYAHSFNLAKAGNNPLVNGLGRKEGTNNSGRKKKVIVDLTIADSVAPAEILMLEYTAPEPVLLLEHSPTAIAEVVADAVADAVKTQLYNVYKKKDNSLVLLGVTLAEAQAAVAKAAASKRAALVIV
jgi:hypothetical protein